MTPVLDNKEVLKTYHLFKYESKSKVHVQSSPAMKIFVNFVVMYQNYIYIYIYIYTRVCVCVCERICYNYIHHPDKLIICFAGFVCVCARARTRAEQINQKNVRRLVAINQPSIFFSKY